MLFALPSSVDGPRLAAVLAASFSGLLLIALFLDPPAFIFPAAGLDFDHSSSAVAALSAHAVPALRSHSSTLPQRWY